MAAHRRMEGVRIAPRSGLDALLALLVRGRAAWAQDDEPERPKAVEEVYRDYRDDGVIEACDHTKRGAEEDARPPAGRGRRRDARPAPGARGRRSSSSRTTTARAEPTPTPDADARPRRRADRPRRCRRPPRRTRGHDASAPSRRCAAPGGGGTTSRRARATSRRWSPRSRRCRRRRRPGRRRCRRPSRPGRRRQPVYVNEDDALPVAAARARRARRAGRRCWRCSTPRSAGSAGPSARSRGVRRAWREARVPRRRHVGRLRRLDPRREVIRAARGKSLRAFRPDRGGHSTTRTPASPSLPARQADRLRKELTLMEQQTPQTAVRTDTRAGEALSVRRLFTQPGDASVRHRRVGDARRADRLACSSRRTSSSRRRGRRTRRTSSPRSTSAGSSTRRRASARSSRWSRAWPGRSPTGAAQRGYFASVEDGDTFEAELTLHPAQPAGGVQLARLVQRRLRGAPAVLGLLHPLGRRHDGVDPRLEHQGGQDLPRRLRLRDQPVEHPRVDGAADQGRHRVRARSRSCAAPTPGPARSSRAARRAARRRWSCSTSTTRTSASSSGARPRRRTRPPRCATPGSTCRSTATASSRSSTRTPTTRSGSPTSSCTRSRTTSSGA